MTTTIKLNPSAAYFALLHDYSQELWDEFYYFGRGGTFSEWRDVDGTLYARLYGSLAHPTDRDGAITDVRVWINMDTFHTDDLIWHATKYDGIGMIGEGEEHPAWAKGKVANRAPCR